MADINIKINGIDVAAPAGSTILEAARLAHIRIPTLMNTNTHTLMCITE